jgi:hypothetical protein
MLIANKTYIKNSVLSSYETFYIVRDLYYYKRKELVVFLMKRIESIMIRLFMKLEEILISLELDAMEVIHRFDVCLSVMTSNI